MKKMVKSSLVVVAGLVIVSTLFAGWDTVPQPKPAQDIIDALVVVPTNILNQYGHTERTRVIFNIAKLLEQMSAQEARIKALETQVAEMGKLEADIEESGNRGALR
jgi:hypothetical protein